MAGKRLQIALPGKDAGVDSAYSAYPSTSYYFTLTNADGTEFHVIFGSTDPNGDTNHDAAPVGSIYSWTGTTFGLFQKTSTTAWTEAT